MPKRNALADYKKKEEQQKHNDLVDALVRLKNGQGTIVKLGALEKIKATHVAKEAKVSRTLLYTTHKDIQKEIEKANKRRGTSRNEARKKQEQKEATKQEIINSLNSDKQKLAQENYRLQLEVDDLHSTVKNLKEEIIELKRRYSFIKPI